MKQKRPQKPWNEQTKVEKIGTVFTMLIGLALLVGCIVLVVQAVQQSNAEDAQANATATAGAATQTVQALTPTPTPTFVHQVTDIVTHHKADDDYSWLHGVITGAACDSAGICHVDDTLPDAFERKDDIQVDCYAIFDAMYKSSLHIQQLTINLFGNVTDKYGNSSKGEIAMAMLTKQTEEKFNWKGLEFWTAWDVYDQTAYLVNGL